MQLANLHSHMLLNARLHCAHFANFAPYILYHYCLHCIILHVQYFQCSLTKQGCCTNLIFAHAAKKTYFQMQNATVPLVLHLPCHSPFFSLAIRLCTIEDSVFICTVNCAMGSSPGAELLHSALLSLPPCYFGAYPLPFFFNLFRFTRQSACLWPVLPHLKHFPVNFPNSIGIEPVLGLLHGCCCCTYAAGA